MNYLIRNKTGPELLEEVRDNFSEDEGVNNMIDSVLCSYFENIDDPYELEIDNEDE